MKITMSFDFLVPQRLHFGWGVLALTGEEVIRLGGEKPLIVTSKGMVKRAGFSELVRLLRDRNMDVVVFNKVEPEPSLETAEGCLRSAREHGCDIIIGLGGGSAMDVAKKVAGDLGLPKIMIPTTAGTGSEVTHEVVLKVRGKKRAFVGEEFLADVAIIDPELMLTMPRLLVASSGIDALAHAIESYYCKRANELTRALSRRAYQLICKNLEKALVHDKTAIYNMALASTMAGMAFGNSGTTLCHALSYPLSNKGVPHGIAVAMTLIPALEFNQVNKELIRKVKALLKATGLPLRYEGDPYEMAKEVMEDERHLSNNPKEVEFEDIVEIYKKIAGGYCEGRDVERRPRT